MHCGLPFSDDEDEIDLEYFSDGINDDDVGDDDDDDDDDDEGEEDGSSVGENEYEEPSQDYFDSLDDTALEFYLSMDSVEVYPHGGRPIWPIESLDEDEEDEDEEEDED